MFKYKKSFKDLVKENREELLKDKKEMDRIEKLIEKRYQVTKLP